MAPGRWRRSPPPAPGQDLCEQPAEGVADDRRLLVEPPDDLLVVVGDLSNRLVGEHLGVGVGLRDGSGSSGQPGVSAVYPASSKTAGQRSQLLGSSHRPCTNTTGCNSGGVGRWTSCASCSVQVRSSLPAYQSFHPSLSLAVAELVHDLIKSQSPRGQRWPAPGGRGARSAASSPPGYAGAASGRVYEHQWRGRDPGKSFQVSPL